MGGKHKLDKLELPEPIIQCIHSLLTEREAARTIILSKSWHRAWLTRPNIDLGDSRFHQRRGDREFSKYAKKTLKRYEQSNLNIDSLKLCMERKINCCGTGADLANKLIVKALRKLGATRLSLRLDRTFVLPCEVVFGANNHLVQLCVQGCTINANDGKVIIKRGCCSRLKSLYLDGLTTTSDGLSNVISSCPSIENLSLSNIKGLEERYSYTVDDDGRAMKPTVHLDVPSIRKFTFVGVVNIIPSLSFVSSPTREWESHVSIKRRGGLTISWFGTLNEFLAELRQSKIHLSLRAQRTKSFDYMPEDVESIVVRKHELESLTIDMRGLTSLSGYALLDGLFRLCRPKLISLDQRKTNNLDLLCEVLEQGMLKKVSFPSQFMYGLNDLEEVSAQVFDTLNNDVPQWRPIPLSSWRDYEDNNDQLLDEDSEDDNEDEDSQEDSEDEDSQEDSEDPDQLLDVPHQRPHRFWLKWKP